MVTVGRGREPRVGACPTMHRSGRVVPQLLGLEKTHAQMASVVISESVDPVAPGSGADRVVVGQESPVTFIVHDPLE